MTKAISIVIALLFITYAVPCQEIYDLTTMDGHLWIEWGFSAKKAYVDGTIASAAITLMFLEKIMGSPAPQGIKDYLQYNSIYDTDIVNGLDIFYSEPKNRDQLLFIVIFNIKLSLQKEGNKNENPTDDRLNNL